MKQQKVTRTSSPKNVTFKTLPQAMQALLLSAPYLYVNDSEMQSKVRTNPAPIHFITYPNTRAPYGCCALFAAHKDSTACPCSEWLFSWVENKQSIAEVTIKWVSRSPVDLYHSTSTVWLNTILCCQCRQCPLCHSSVQIQWAILNVSHWEGPK